MSRILFLLRLVLFGNLFFWLGHSLWNSRVARPRVLADGRLDYGEFMAVFLLIMVSVILGWLAASSFGRQRRQPEVRWEQDTRSDDIMDVFSPHIIEKIDHEAETNRSQSVKRGDKRSRFREEIKRDVTQGGKS